MLSGTVCFLHRCYNSIMTVINTVCAVISAYFMLATNNCAMSGGTGGTCRQLQKAISLMRQHYTHDTAWRSSQGVYTFNISKKFNKITLGWQPCDVVCLNYMTPLSTRENVTEFSCHENFRTYISDKYPGLKRYLLLTLNLLVHTTVGARINP